MSNQYDADEPKKQQFDGEIFNVIGFPEVLTIDDIAKLYGLPLDR